MSGPMIVVKLCAFITRDQHCFHHLPFSSQWYDVVDGVGEKSAESVLLMGKTVTRIRPIFVRTIQSLLIDVTILSLEMIPTHKHVDYAWSEFERYSTNSYIRQLLDNRAAALVSGINTDIA